MKRSGAGLGILLAGVILWGSAQGQGPFPDVPPCHWAAGAVTELAGKSEVTPEQALNSRYLAENSIRQVFEGLRCESPEWSRGFVASAPTDWPTSPRLENFQLTVTDLQLMETQGTAIVTLLVVADGTTSERSGELELSFDGGMWRVDYQNLRRLDLPLFP
ncbi:MAG: hypothetical protein WD273_10125 [Trueperaceae bacterium]